jgi:hypothetical protein
MTGTDQRAFAETVFERNQGRDAKINEALKQENARREAAVKNMYRLKALRLERDQKAKDK